MMTATKLREVEEALPLIRVMRTRNDVDEEWDAMHKESGEALRLKEDLGDDWHCQCNPLCGRPYGHAGDHDNYLAKQMIEADEAVAGSR